RHANSTRTVTLNGSRGSIFSEDKVCLAQTTFSGASLVVNPRAVPADERAEVATRIAGLLGKDSEYARNLEAELYQRRDKYYYCIEREVAIDTTEAIDAELRLGRLPG